MPAKLCLTVNSRDIVQLLPKKLADFIIRYDSKIAISLKVDFNSLSVVPPYLVPDRLALEIFHIMEYSYPQVYPHVTSRVWQGLNIYIVGLSVALIIGLAVVIVIIVFGVGQK